MNNIIDIHHVCFFQNNRLWFDAGQNFKHHSVKVVVLYSACVFI